MTDNNRRPVTSRDREERPIRLVLADGRLLILDALEALFQAAGGFVVAARCRHGEELLEAARRERPDVLVVDFRLPRMDGLEVARRLGETGTACPVVLLVDGIREREVNEALRLRVAGLILTEMPGSLLIRCVRAVHAGEPWLERRSAARLLQKLVRDESGRREAESVLTHREIEVTRMAGKGLRNRAIAAELGISESTVKVHLGHVYAKLGARSRLDLYRFAADKGLL